MRSTPMSYKKNITIVVPELQYLSTISMSGNMILKRIIATPNLNISKPIDIPHRTGFT